MENKVSTILHEKLDEIIGKALKEQIFTACSVGFFRKDKEGNSEGDIFNYGFTEQGESGYPVDEGTVFDLASLTKPLVTSLSLLALLDEGRVNLEDQLDKYIASSPPEKKKTTLLHLLTHSSGLPAHRPYYRQLVALPDGERIGHLINCILLEKLIFLPGTDCLYSDLGFILLGRIVELVTGEPLDGYWQRKIIIPLHLENGLFFACKREMDGRRCVATGNCPWSNRRLRGIVHDDNCRALGGVAGHAGLFGTTGALLSLLEKIVCLFQGDKQTELCCPTYLQRVIQADQGPWRFGFDTPTPGISASGRFFSDLSLGHLGFTGTSFWIDLRKEIGIVLLTNRVLCGEELTGIKKFRPLIHNTIMEFLIKKSG